MEVLTKVLKPAPLGITLSFWQPLGTITLLFLFALTANAQTGKESLGPSVHGDPVSKSTCSQRLAESVWAAGGQPTDASPTLATTIDQSTNCGTGPKKGDEKPVYSSVIIHGSVWDYDSTANSVKMIASEWEIYHPSAAGLKEDKQKGYPLTPELYGKPKVLFLGLACFVHAGADADPAGKVDVSWKISTTQVTPANLANLNSVLNAWLGIAKATKSEQRPVACQTGVLTSYEIKDKLPYDISITPSAKLGSDSGKQTQDCSTITTTSCTNAARTFHNLDAEFWDLSAGFALPGVREPQYASSNPALLIAPIRHNDFFGLLDLYPFAAVASKTSPVPHFAVGIPVTGKVFSRPFFGIAECITGAPYFQNHSVPLISLLYGVVYLNQEVTIPNPSGSGFAIGHSRVLKGTFALEISLSPLLSKIKAVGGSSGSSPSTGNTKGGTSQ